ELKSYNVDFTAAKDEVLKLLNNSNFPALSDNEWKEKISNFAKCNYKILKLLYEVIIKKFGTIEKKEILISPKKGKAILVSGSSYSDLEKILKLAAKSGINVYTHHEMLSAHEYEQLNKYENLKGHYQHFSNSFPLDFAEFPGPIYISGNSIPKLDVIRGQIYTSAKYPPFGIGKIENNDFSPLIVYAQNSTGFLKDSDEKTMVVGFSYCEIENIIEDIINKFNTESIKKLFIIGLSNPFNNNTDYLKKFINECPEDYYIMSFGYDSKRKNNFFKVNSFYDFSAVYYIIEKLSEKTETLIENTAVFLTDCTYNTVSHIFNLLYSGIKNIFLGTCCPDTINPKMAEGLNNLYGIHKLTTPYEDIKKIK
ncbi:MAG: hypothetical protein LUG16_07580, partial [Candidatus Gastranaerophilales bacterium]|nr:hypothetical protein [Candidatus Gastranaerophilales bacterium]